MNFTLLRMVQNNLNRPQSDKKQLFLAPLLLIILIFACQVK
ncbi:hypothetical protein SAMN05421594_2388 [Chryseobacterium oleae]|uniref:Uncharacterized protein n=1 Tax=Chryseobacterium oleae TaxID=491207 RepID=A0A1I4YFT1_CHROL|nr:hypothetical protein SAMN05421594_2388 [Chryseobacterium oleae]